MDPRVPYRSDEAAQNPPQSGPPPGSPIPRDAPTSPIVHGPPPGWTPGGTPSGQGTYRSEGMYRTDGTPPDGTAFPPKNEPAFTGGPMGTRETSGIQVRLGTQSGRARREQPPAEPQPHTDYDDDWSWDDDDRKPWKGRRAGIITAAVVALAGLVMAGVFLSSNTREDEAGNAAAGGGEQPNRPASVSLPDAGKPVEVGTADGSRYRIATVTAGVSDGATPTTHSAPPSGTAYPYIEYILTNPTDEKVLLDFPGDVFVKTALVSPGARGRCEPQAGAPDSMCTPPTESRVTRPLAGGEAIPGEGGDEWMPPGSSYLVRTAVTVPVDRDIGYTDMRLYIWRQLYMHGKPAKLAPFPSD